MSTLQRLRSEIVRLLKPKFAKLTAAGALPKYILDIGIANDSYAECKAIFPNAEYHGLDFIDAKISMASGDLFFLRDIEDSHSLDGLEPIYDVIIANHVLEHLERGAEVFGQLCHLLAPGGLLYVEVPSLRTAYHAKRGGNYHFHDDPTHRTFYKLEDLANTAIRANCQIVSCGPASTRLKDLLSVPRASIGIFRSDGWGPYLIHLQRKIDHILVKRHQQHDPVGPD